MVEKTRRHFIRRKPLSALPISGAAHILFLYSVVSFVRICRNVVHVKRSILQDWITQSPYLCLHSNGVTTGYQTRKITFLRTLGAEVVVAAINVTSQTTADTLVKKATDMGPPGGVFNLGLVSTAIEFWY